MKEEKTTSFEASLKDVEGPNGFNIWGQKYMITYKTHVEKDMVIELLQSKTVNQCGPIKWIRVAHETGDEHHPYDHSHVVVDFGKRFQSGDCRVFDFMNIHPHIKRICTPVHWKRSVAYLAKEDPENADLEDKREIVERVMDCSSEQEVLTLCKRPGDAIGLLTIYKHKIEDPLLRHEATVLRGWQLFLHEELMGPVNTRKIIWYYDPDGNCGKSFFADFMDERYPKKCIILEQMGGQRDCATILLNEWKVNKLFDTIIVDLPRDAEHHSIYAPLEGMKNGRMTAVKYEGRTFRFPVCHVVIMANFEPDRNRMSADRWDIRRLGSSVPRTELEDSDE